MSPHDDRSRAHARLRSRSPDRSSYSDRKRHRSRSRHNLRRRHYQDRGHEQPDTATTVLPFHAQQFSKHDLAMARPMLGLYLDIQKHLVIEDLTSDEIRGRWKSFVRKWNHGELAEGWYDPETLEKARRSPSRSEPLPSALPRVSLSPVGSGSDESYGPTLPTDAQESGAQPRNLPQQGPPRARMQDLQVKHETVAEEAKEARIRDRKDLRTERGADRRLQKERLDEIAPRAEAGTRERQLEKKREKADSNRSFAASAHDSADVEVQDSEMMGGGDGIGELKQMKQATERKKSERQTRREEQLAARRAEREDRVQAMREREEQTMGVLKDIARARFGDGP